jgi:hypothetical protein
MSDQPRDTKDDDLSTVVAGQGDDEREQRESIEQDGEPQRDALGNADGAS